MQRGTVDARRKRKKDVRDGNTGNVDILALRGPRRARVVAPLHAGHVRALVALVQTTLMQITMQITTQITTQITVKTTIFRRYC